MGGHRTRQCHQPIGADWVAIVFGLGFVLSFGYWTTNFAEVQRALAAKNLSAARRTPLIAALPKLLIPFLVVVPGLIAAVTVKGLGAKTGDLQFNNAVPILISTYPTGCSESPSPGCWPPSWPGWPPT
jgi:SSS family solute:Na+ symporter